MLKAKQQKIVNIFKMYGVNVRIKDDHRRNGVVTPAVKLDTLKGLKDFQGIICGDFFWIRRGKTIYLCDTKISSISDSFIDGLMDDSKFDDFAIFHFDDVISR